MPRKAARQYKDVFLLVRGLRKFLNLQIRLGGALGLRRVGPSLTCSEIVLAANGAARRR